MEFSHVPVLLDEAVEGLKLKCGGVYVDGTLGGGGHSYEIAARLKKLGGSLKETEGNHARLICIDRDESAIEAASKKLEPFKDLVTIVHGNFRDTGEILSELKINGIDGMLLDLGVSSYQFDEAERGFSYRTDAPLDMRMDRGSGPTAADIVNGYTEAELYRIIRDYGEERFAKNIAKHIVLARKEKPVKTTFELSGIIKASIPARMREGGGHPAKKTFQAIRIEVNSELDILSCSLEGLIKLLNPGGRLAVISFHSLEDRIVKNCFRKAADPCTCPKDIPVCVCGKKPLGRVVTRKPVTPGKEELLNNNRAHSAKLRIFERTP